MKKILRILRAAFRLFDIERRGLVGTSYTNYINDVNCCAVCGSPILAKTVKFGVTTTAGTTYCFAGLCEKHEKFTVGENYAFYDESGNELLPVALFDMCRTNLSLFTHAKEK